MAGTRVTDSGRVLLAVSAALLLTMLDTTLVTVALPDLQQHSSLGVSDLQWAVNGYLVVFASLTLLGGTLADSLGRRRLLVAGLVVFAAGSVLTAASAPTGGWDGVRAGRLIQGLGAALSEPATLAVIRAGWRDAARRRRALGTWAAVAGLGIALGPVLGGLLVEAAGWRAVFWANVPLALVALVAVLAWVPESRDPGGRRLDLPGAALGAALLGGIAWALIQGQEAGFRDRAVVAAEVGAAVAGVLLVLRERRAVDPLLPPDLVAGPAALGANAAALAASFAVFAVYFFVTLDLQAVGHASARDTALAFLPMSVALVGAALVAGRLRVPARWLMTGGLLAAATGLVAVDAALGLDPHLGTVAAELTVVGTGLGLVLAPAAATVLDAVEPERAGIAAAVVNLSRQVGALLAVAVLGAVAVGRLNAALDDRLGRLGLLRFRAQVFAQVTHPGADLGLPPGAGGAPGSSGPGAAGASGGLLDRLIEGVLARVRTAAEQAFVSGLHLALLVAVGVLVLAAVVCAVGRHGAAAAARR